MSLAIVLDVMTDFWTFSVVEKTENPTVKKNPPTKIVFFLGGEMHDGGVVRQRVVVVVLGRTCDLGLMGDAFFCAFYFAENLTKKYHSFLTRTIVNFWSRTSPFWPTLYPYLTGMRWFCLGCGSGTADQVLAPSADLKPTKDNFVNSCVFATIRIRHVNTHFSGSTSFLIDPTQ